MHVIKRNNTILTFLNIHTTLHEFIESQSGKQEKHPKLIFDNAKIHLTADVRRLCSYLRFEINTLPPYSPQLAPVETIFGISKKRFQARYKEIGMNFGKPSGKRAVLNTLKSISTETCNKIWNKFVRVAKEWIVSAHGSTRLRRMLQSYNEDIKEIEKIYSQQKNTD